MSDAQKGINERVVTPATKGAAVAVLERPKDATAERQAQKQAKWAEKRAEIDLITDGAGRPIDEGIKETVVAFNMVGLSTWQSCEGDSTGTDDEHGHHSDTPYVAFMGSFRPETRYNNEKEICTELASQHGFSFDEVWNSTTPAAADIRYDAAVRSSANGETEEFKKWEKEYQELGRKIQTYVDEFNTTRDVPENVKINVSDEVLGVYTVCSGTVREQDMFAAAKGQGIPIERDETLLLARRTEMAALTDFLRERYFSEGDSED